jgi:hypothetical protein
MDLFQVSPTLKKIKNIFKGLNDHQFEIGSKIETDGHKGSQV